MNAQPKALPASDTDANAATWQIVTVPESALDGGGGAALEGLVGSVRVQAMRLCALDVQSSPGLVELDLSRCSGDLVLALKELPALARVILPESSAGLHIELALAPGNRRLSLQGRVGDLGVCANWLDHGVRLSEEIGRRVVDGVVIGPLGEVGAFHQSEICLAIGRGPTTDRLELDCRGLSALVVIGGRCRELVLANAQLERLALSENPRLERLGGPFRAGHASLALCRSLARIEGQGEALDIDCCQTDSLTVTGQWRQVNLSNSELWQARLPAVDNLRLTATPVLHDLRIGSQTQLDAEPGPLGTNCLLVHFERHPGRLSGFVDRCQTQFEADQGRLHDWLTGLVKERHGTRLGDLLGGLGDLVQHGAPAAAAWKLRCLTHAMGRGMRPTGAFDRAFIDQVCSQWSWPAQMRQAASAWSSDLRLFCLCRALPEADAFAANLPQPERLRHIDALARACIEPAAFPGLQTLPIAEITASAVPSLDIHTELLAELPDSSYSSWMLPEAPSSLQTELFDFIDCLHHAGLASTLESLADHLADSLADWPQPNLPARAGLRLHELGVASSRALLAATLHHSDTLDNGLRSEVLYRLLAPIPLPTGRGVTGG